MWQTTCKKNCVRKTKRNQWHARTIIASELLLSFSLAQTMVFAQFYVLWMDPKSYMRTNGTLNFVFFWFCFSAFLFVRCLFFWGEFHSNIQKFWLKFADGDLSGKTAALQDSIELFMMQRNAIYLEYRHGISLVVKFVV